MEVDKNIRLVFRYDDYSGTSPMDVDGRLIEVLGRNGFSCTFGVTPFITTGEYRDPTPRACVQLDGVKAEMLRDGVGRGIVDIALHGYNHRAIHYGPPYSEFMGLDYPSQLERISQGKRILEETCDVAVSVFIPPWNTYDLNTLRALEATGICCMSANRYGLVDHGRSIAYLPITIELQDLRMALSTARNSDDVQPIIVVLMHPYDFTESKDSRGRCSVDALNDELAWLSSQADVKVYSISNLLLSGENLGSDRYSANAPILLESALPPFIERTQERAFYLSLKKAKRVKRSTQMCVAIFYLLVIGGGVAFGYIGSLIFAGLGEAVADAFTYSIIVTLSAAIIRSVVKRQVYFRGFLLCSIGLGLLLGSLIARVM